MAQQTAANEVLGWSAAFLGVVSVTAIARAGITAMQAIFSPGDARPSLWKIARPVIAAAVISLVVSGGILAGIAQMFK